MNGFRFIAHNGALTWKHPAEIPAGAVDCTDMTDAEFEAQVCRTVGIFKFCTVAA